MLQTVSNTSTVPIVDLCQQMCQVRPHSQLSFSYLPFDQLAGSQTYAGILFFLDMVLEPIVLTNAAATTTSAAAGITVELDLTGFTLASFMRHLKFFRRVATHFQTKYPNRLQKCWVHNAPTFVRQVCTMLATFVDARTMEKIEFVG